MNGNESRPSSPGDGRAANPSRYLFTLTDGGGTVPPELGVARRLIERGHHVTVLADVSMAAEARRTGASYLPWTVAPAGELRDWQQQSPARLARDMVEHMITGPAPDQARDVAGALEETRPKLVLSSFFAFGSMIAAEAQRVPFDVLLPNIYPLPAKGLPPTGAGLAPAHGPLGRLRDRSVKTITARMFDRYALAPINSLRADSRLDPITTTWDQIRHANRQLILTSPAFDFPAELPENARYMGPVLDDPVWASDAVWTEPTGEGPIVLVAMSSTFQNQIGCLQRILDALGTLPVRGVVTTGPAIQTETLRAPSNVSVIASAPHRKVMRQASLVITHGGHGTVIKSLAAGLPLVILHHGRDQSDNAIRVTARGAGIAVPRRAPAGKIAFAVTKILGSPSYKAAAEKLGHAVARDAAANTALLLDELEN